MKLEKCLLRKFFSKINLRRLKVSNVKAENLSVDKLKKFKKKLAPSHSL
jgi:hypothetical protein